MRLAIWIAAGVAACAEQPPAAAQEPAPTPSATPTVVATWKDGTMTSDTLEAMVAADVAKLESEHLLALYDLRMQALESAVVDELIAAEVKRRGLPDVDALIEAEVLTKAAPPTADQIDQLWKQASAQYPGVTRDQMGPYLSDEATRRNQVDRYGAFVDELKASAGMDLLLPYPDLPRVNVPLGPNELAVGPANAPVTIVQFLEYQCYYCNKALPTLDKIVAAYGDRVRIVYKDFPLPGHERAMPAAVAARCAAEQGKHSEMNHRLLGNQGALSDGDLERHAEAVGMDRRAFTTCVASGRHAAAIQADLDLGQSIGVGATPTFFVNGVLVAGALPFERFAALIEKELGAG